MSIQRCGTEAREPFDPVSLSGRSILIIDDELDFAESLGDLLEADGCRIKLFADAADVREPLPAFRPELVLLDIRLKQTNGIDLMDRLRSFWPDARIVVMTGFASKDTAIRALKNGAFDYLEKPIHTDELHATMVRALWAYDADVMVRATQEKMRSSLRKAEVANRSKSAFLANMSHEIRTPLNAILGFSEAIKDGRLGPLSLPAYKNYAEDIHMSGHRILSIVNDLLDISQAEPDAKQLNEELVRLAEVVGESCDIVEAAARDRNITLLRTVPANIPQVRADRRLVKQMLINLLKNAIEFTKTGGRVGVLVSHDENGNILLEVGDNGIGIDADKIEDVLEPFVIAGTVETRNHTGVGLGLAITKRLIERHGGQLDLRSQKGVGTVVTLVIPAERIEGRPHGSKTH